MKRVLITGANVGTNIEQWLDKSFDGSNKLFKGKCPKFGFSE